jgi:uncharacterized protein YutE (UPF0331/DUF86 family)
MPVERKKVLMRLEKIEQFVQHLRQPASQSYAEFHADVMTQAAAERFLQLAIEGLIDAAAYLCSSQGFRRPTSYQDTLTALEENHVLSAALVNRLKPLIRLRNQLVHVYWDIDTRRVHRVLTTQLDAFETFSEQVLDYLDRIAPPK